jgi:hypothetical protein
MAIDKLKSSALNLQDDVAMDTDTLFVDASTDRVGIGTTTPSVELDLQSTTSGTKMNVQTSSNGFNVDLQDATALSRIRHTDTKLIIGADHNALGTGDQVVQFNIGNSPKASITQYGGIAFGSSSAEADTLDDYEEGIFQLKLSIGGTDSGALTASYVKVGRLVHISIPHDNSTNNPYYNDNTSGGSAASVGTDVDMTTTTGFGQLPFTPHSTGNGLASWHRGLRTRDTDELTNDIYAYGWVKGSTQLYIGRTTRDGNEYSIFDGVNSGDTNNTLEKDSAVSNVVLAASFTYYTED